MSTTAGMRLIQDILRRFGFVRLELVHETVVRRSSWHTGPGVLNVVAATQVADAILSDLRNPPKETA